MGLSDDRAALRAACEPDVGLCTIVGIEGSFSRRLGAQLAVRPDGSVVGSLADGCLERQLASEIAAADAPIVRRFGRGSDLIDFRLPCGSGLDLLIDPAPDRAAARAAVAELDARRPAALALSATGRLLRDRCYIPPPRLLIFGEGPEPAALRQFAGAGGLAVDMHGSADGLSLGRAPRGLSVDPWTAIVLLFHDHEWEGAILDWALDTPAFFIGAQGGAETRVARLAGLAAKGRGPDQLARIHSPVGLIPRTREPGVLALSILAQIASEYEALHPHG